VLAHALVLGEQLAIVRRDLGRRVLKPSGDGGRGTSFQLPS
jgi:hypothetical protein